MPCNASATRHARAGSPEAVAVAVAVAHQSDAVVLFLGEESILSGEAHWRADISLPGARPTLVGRMRETGRPVVAFIMAGRPLALSGVLDDVDTMLFAWCPGTMGGAALAGPLFGLESPSGKLPVTFPRMVGQIPTYYSQKNTGKPPTRQSICTFATWWGASRAPSGNSRPSSILARTPGETLTIDFELQTGDLAFFGRHNELVTKPGEFRVWVGGSPEADLGAGFLLIEAS